MQASILQRKVVYYGGQVQGVGFRYTTERISRQYDVVGYVRNLSDGRVELVVESSADELTKFLNAIAETMNEYIRNTEIESLPGSGEFKRFEILR